MRRRQTNCFHDDWEEIGFCYDRDDRALIWYIVGSRSGMKEFCDALRAYVRSFDTNLISGPKYLAGPYRHLKIVNWHMASVLIDGIYGPLEKIDQLAETIETRLTSHNPGDKFIIDKEFSEVNAYKLEFVVREDGWDPESFEGV